MQPEFNFFQHWYPLTPVEDLDPHKPTPVTLLGLRLIIWKPASSETYRVFLDQCPHRLAPLSEGRVDEKTGNLMCSYHGWQFDAQGSCTRIPQAENPQLIDKNRENFCVSSLPCRQENDLLWVWPDVNSAELAASTELPLSPQIDASMGFVWSSFVRDLEYDWQTLVENVADPSHVPFAHHGVQGKREQAGHLNIEILESTIDTIKAYAVLGGLGSSIITFKPPCYLEYAISFGGEKQVGLITYCLPVAPGKSRIVAQFPRNFAKALQRLIPRWWTHIKTRNLVLEGDMILLHQQEYFVQQQGNWKNAYQLPTSADRLVIEFRKWFDTYCQGKLSWSEVNLSNQAIPPIKDNRQILLDRYSQHTQHCRSCRDALARVKLLEKLLLGYFILTISGVAVLPDQLRLSWGLPLMLTALLGLGAYTWLKFSLEAQFYFVDYIHAERK